MPRETAMFSRVRALLGRLLAGAGAVAPVRSRNLMRQDLLHPEGWDIEWLAVDRLGQFALLTTGGFGPFPAALRPLAAQHDAVLSTIETPRFGTPEVWRDYADVGLFAFDWDVPDGPYRRVAEPAAVMPDALRAALVGLHGLPVCRYEFRAVRRVGVADFDCNAPPP